MATGKANSFINSLLKLIFNGTAMANVADNAATSPLTNLYAALHTVDPGAAGSQITSEATYTGYARVAIARTTAGFTVSGQSVFPVLDIAWPIATAGSETETFFSIGTLAAGAGVILYRGTITPSIVVAAGVTPVCTAATTITEA